MSFEDMAGYAIIAIVFVAVFIPLMGGFIVQAQSIADAKTAFMLALIIPFIILALIVAFFIRMRGSQPFGEF